MKKITFLITGLAFSGVLLAQEKINNGTEVIQSTFNGISKPLSELPDAEIIEHSYEMKESADRKNRVPQIFDFTVEKDGAAYGNDPNSIQTKMGNRMVLAPIVSFAGQSGNGYPPDPTGAVGPTNYVQAVNATPFKVYNKTGGQVMAPKNIGALWSPALTYNNGDPIVMYDKFADRWFISQFGDVDANNTTLANKIYIAISTTNNPAGTYYTYTFTSSSFPDYLKFSIWQDGYYMTSNQGGRLYVFERAKMLLGQTAKVATATFTLGGTSGFMCPLPADADGTLAPAGTACPFFWYTDNSWSGSVDGIKYCKATVNWTTSTLTITSPTQITTPAFDGTYNSSWDDIPQPGTTVMLDGIGGVATYRAQYRRWTGYNTVLLNWGVLIANSPRQRAIKWVELREQNATPGVWTIYQQGTYAPDTKCRWVGSIAMDDNGSIALCYARAASTTSASAIGYPSLCYTGRLATDPLGTMTFAETVAKAGTSSQVVPDGYGGYVNRFGDYSQTSIDPTDGITFWHTGEYITGNNPATWIYSFKLPVPATGIEESQNQINTISAYQTIGAININATNLKEEGELVVDLFDISGRQIDGKRVVTNGNSFETSFSTNNLAAGTYLVRVGKMNTSFQKVVKVVVK